MEYNALTYSNSIYGFVVEGIKNRLNEKAKLGWKAEGGINITYDSKEEKYYANVLLIRED